MQAEDAGRSQLLPQLHGLPARAVKILEIAAAIAPHQLADAVAQHGLMVGGIDEGGAEKHIHAETPVLRETKALASCQS